MPLQKLHQGPNDVAQGAAKLRLRGILRNLEKLVAVVLAEPDGKVWRQKEMLTREENNQRMALYREGLSDKQIARRVFVCKEAIRRWRKKNGLPPVANQRKLSPEAREARLDMIKSGMKQADIARTLGISREAVRGWMKYWGLKHG